MNDQRSVLGLPKIANGHRCFELSIGARVISEGDNLVNMRVASGTTLNVRFIGGRGRTEAGKLAGTPASDERALRVQLKANRDMIKNPDTTMWAYLDCRMFEQIPSVQFAVGKRCTAFSLSVSITGIGCLIS
jgi:hypothetical protein